MFNDDDFFLDDDEFAEDNQVSLVDSAKIRLLNSIKETCDNMLDSIKFNEPSEVESHTRILAGYVDHIITLSSINVNGLSEEEIYEEIDKVMTSTTTLTFGNINEILPDEEETDPNGILDDTDNGESTDW